VTLPAAGPMALIGVAALPTWLVAKVATALGDDGVGSAVEALACQLAAPEVLRARTNVTILYYEDITILYYEDVTIVQYYGVYCAITLVHSAVLHLPLAVTPL